jgi:hypothetical protein
MPQALGTIQRTHGNPAGATLHGGYQTQFYLVTGTNIGTTDTGGGTTAIVEGNFSKAIRAIQTIATTVFIGPAVANGFVIGVDGATAQPDGPAYDTDANPDFATRLKAVLDANTGVTTTVTAKTLTYAPSTNGAIV